MQFAVLVKDEWDEFLNGDLMFLIEEGIYLRFGEEHFFIRVEKVNIDLLILGSFAQVFGD